MPVHIDTALPCSHSSRRIWFLAHRREVYPPGRAEEQALDWFPAGALIIIGVAAVLIAWSATCLGKTRRSKPADPDDLDVLRRKQDDIRRGTSWENSGL